MNGIHSNLSQKETSKNKNKLTNRNINTINKITTKCNNKWTVDVTN